MQRTRRVRLYLLSTRDFKHPVASRYSRGVIIGDIDVVACEDGRVLLLEWLALFDADAYLDDPALQVDLVAMCRSAG